MTRLGVSLSYPPCCTLCINFDATLIRTPRHNMAGTLASTHACRRATGCLVNRIKIPVSCLFLCLCQFLRFCSSFVNIWWYFVLCLNPVFVSTVWSSPRQMQGKQHNNALKWNPRAHIGILQHMKTHALRRKKRKKKKKTGFQSGLRYTSRLTEARHANS